MNLCRDHAKTAENKTIIGDNNDITSFVCNKNTAIKTIIKPIQACTVLSLSMLNDNSVLECGRFTS